MKSLPLDYVLVTERLRLRIPSEADLKCVFEASRFPGFTQGMMWNPPEDIDALREPLARSIANWKAAEAYQFSIDVEGVFVGRIALRETESPSVLDIGYWLHPLHQKRGYMTEAIGAVVRLGFETMGAQSIVADYAEWNEASRRILEAVGFLPVRTWSRGFHKGATASDEIRACLERWHWQEMTRANPRG